MCDPYDFEPAVSLDDSFRKARKSHRCFACREEIPLGHRYHVTAQIFDGAFDSYKHCLRCWEMVRAIWARGEACEFGLDCGETWEDVMGEPPPPELVELAFMTPEEAQARFPVKP